MSSVDMRLKAVRLGSSEVAVSYPRALDSWFEGLVEQWDESIAPRKWVRLCAHREPGQFDVLASVYWPRGRSRRRSISAKPWRCFGSA